MALINSGEQEESATLADLTVIRGVGMVRKRWLNRMGIHSLSDLAAASVDAILEQAKHEGRSLSSTDIAGWIQQAQDYGLVAPTALPTSPDSSLETGASTDGDESLLESADVDTNTGDRDDWSTLASVQLKVQTRHVDGETHQRFVVHHQEAKVTEIWERLETERLQQWCYPHSEVELPSVPIPSSMAAEITQIRVLQPHHMTQPIVVDTQTPIISEPLNSETPFALEVSVQFTDFDHVDLSQPIAYRVQCLARHITTGVTHSLGDVTTPVSLHDDTVHHAFLPSVQLPQAGDYRMKVFLTVKDMPAVSSHFKVPLLQVLDFSRIGTCRIA
jgi:hypothetical protein